MLGSTRSEEGKGGNDDHRELAEGCNIGRQVREASIYIHHERTLGGDDVGHQLVCGAVCDRCEVVCGDSSCNREMAEGVGVSKVVRGGADGFLHQAILSVFDSSSDGDSAMDTTQKQPPKQQLNQDGDKLKLLNSMEKSWWLYSSSIFWWLLADLGKNPEMLLAVALSAAATACVRTLDGFFVLAGSYGMFSSISLPTRTHSVNAPQI